MATATKRELEELFARLIARLDIRALPRVEWRGAFHGAERPIVQRFLLDMADTAHVGPRADRLALLKAAYAVLPFHGPELIEFGDLLAQERPVAAEWMDALVEALAADPPGTHREEGMILAALAGICEQYSDSAVDTRRRRYLVQHLYFLGYRPQWVITAFDMESQQMESQQMESQQMEPQQTEPQQMESQQMEPQQTEPQKGI